MDIGQIYDEYGQIVYKYLLCLCHDEHLAQDLTQETFCKAIQSVHRFLQSFHLVVSDRQTSLVSRTGQAKTAKDHRNRRDCCTSR